mgnify:FL=1
MTRLADAYAFALSSDLDVRVGLAPDHDIVLDQLDRIVLTIVAGLVLWREATELLRVQDLVIVGLAIDDVLEGGFLGVLALYL